VDERRQPAVALFRENEIKALKQGRFELLVIGGGATGAGIALDAASRGLRVALVERDDFASGTSSRSTKLVHGGVRYLEQAIKLLDLGRLGLVNAALRERAVILRIAPHLTRRLAFLTPLYRWRSLPYYYTGLKLYDHLAGRLSLGPSRFVSAQQARARFPAIKRTGLKGGLIYFDGQFDDARMNLSLVLTARQYGAVVANHVEVRGLDKRSARIRAAVVHDHIAGDDWEIEAQVVINAAGPFADLVRRMDDPLAKPTLNLSSGVHIVLDQRLCAPDLGLLIPRTADGRVIFLIPWMGTTLAGTTDSPAAVDFHPQAANQDIDYILRELATYLEHPIDRSEIKAAWSGLRPLIGAANVANTAALPRDHAIDVSPSGLITVVGGKWTTYRLMAKEAVDRAIELGGFAPRLRCFTDQLLLLGAHELRLEGEQAAGCLRGRNMDADLPVDVASHLRSAYGDRAPQVAEIAARGYFSRLAQGYPFIEADVLWAVREEMACTVMDVLARRTRLAFLDNAAARAAVPRVSKLLAQEFHWDELKLKVERQLAEERLAQGL
jgi:glycerol-3-phosphate dehydrogenase